MIKNVKIREECESTWLTLVDIAGTKRTQRKVKISYILFFHGSLHYSDVYRLESGRFCTLPFFLTFLSNNMNKYSYFVFQNLMDCPTPQIHKSGSLESCLNSILWFAGRIRHNINLIAEFSQSRISLAHKVRVIHISWKGKYRSTKNTK